MSREYAGEWRALIVLEREDKTEEYLWTEPPTTYEDVEQHLWHLGHLGLKLEGKRVKRSLIVPVAT